MIKMGTDPDNKAKYIKLTKHLLIATVLITLSLTLIEIPKYYFGNTVEITDGQVTDMTIGKIEDNDCQGRETVNIDGKRYVVTDTNVKLSAISEDRPFMQVQKTSTGIEIDTGKYYLENCCILRAFSECQGTFKGFFADIKYYRDVEGTIFPAIATYKEYLSMKGNGGTFTNNSGDGSRRRCRSVVDKKTIKIPTEIKLKTEFFDGYGMQELIKTIVIGVIASIIAYIVNLFTHQTLFATFFVIGAIVISVIALIKGQNNFSMVDSIKNIIKFNLMQKEYKYTRGNFNIKHIKEEKN